MAAKHYNLQNIRTLLMEGFTDAELRRFCYDRPDFRPVYEELASTSGKGDIVHQLIEYADRKALLDIPLNWAKENNHTKYMEYQPYFSGETVGIALSDSDTNQTPQTNLLSTNDTVSKQHVQIFMQGDFTALSPERRESAIVAFAAILGILPQDIAVYRVYEGSIVFDLGIPSDAVERLHTLLQTNNSQLRLLKIEKIRLNTESGEEEWILREGRFDLVAPSQATSPGSVTSESRDNIRELLHKHFMRLQILKEREAMYGSSVDPWMSIEIEDIEAEIEKLQAELDALGGSAPEPPVASRAPTSSPTATFRQIKVKNLEARLEALVADYEAASNQLNNTLNEVDRARLKRQVEGLEQEISQVENELNSLR